jgi:fatty-acyl-CoA synthase
MNGHLSDALHFWARRFPDRVALRFPQADVTWREYDQAVDEVAAGLHEHGVRPGDVVGILMSNRREFLYAAIAIFRAGATLELLNYRFTPHEMVHPIIDAGTKLVFAESQHVHILDQAVAEMPELTVVSADKVEGVRTLDEFRRVGGSPPPRRTSPEEIALLAYTSGTTGTPKGAMLSHRAIIANGLARAVAEGATWRDNMLMCVPLAFTGGIGTYLRESLILGATSILVPDLEAGGLLETLVREKVSVCTTVPVIWERMLALPELGSADLSALTSATSAGATTPLEVIKAYQALGVGLRQGWGQTEAGGGFATILYDDEAEPKLGSVGRPIMYHEIKIVDEADHEVPAGEAGQILVRGPSVMTGYWNRPEATAETLAGGWLHTGDIGVVDDEGYLRMLDRAKDMLISGGLNVYPAEIEKVIAGLPGLEECAVIGVPDKEWGEVPMIVVPSLDGIDLLGLTGTIVDRLADYRRPRWIAPMGGIFPRTMSGKIRKVDIRAAFPEVPEAAVNLKQLASRVPRGTERE